MPYSDPEKQKEYDRLRSLKRRAYFREYKREHPQPYVYKSNKSTYKYKATSMAYKGEVLALKVLVGSKKINRPCDLDWKGKLVDVKTAKPTKTTNGGIVRWKFLLTKQKQVADLFLLICKGSDDKVIGIYLIPNKDIKHNNLSFSLNSTKYSKYLLSL